MAAWAMEAMDLPEETEPPSVYRPSPGSSVRGMTKDDAGFSTPTDSRAVRIPRFRALHFGDSPSNPEPLPVPMIANEELPEPNALRPADPTVSAGVEQDALDQPLTAKEEATLEALQKRIRARREAAQARDEVAPGQDSEAGSKQKPQVKAKDANSKKKRQVKAKARANAVLGQDIEANSEDMPKVKAKAAPSKDNEAMSSKTTLKGQAMKRPAAALAAAVPVGKRRATAGVEPDDEAAAKSKGVLKSTDEVPAGSLTVLGSDGKAAPQKTPKVLAMKRSAKSLEDQDKKCFFGMRPPSSERAAAAFHRLKALYLATMTEVASKGAANANPKGKHVAHQRSFWQHMRNAGKGVDGNKDGLASIASDQHLAAAAKDWMNKEFRGKLKNEEGGSAKGKGKAKAKAEAKGKGSANDQAASMEKFQGELAAGLWVPVPQWVANRAAEAEALARARAQVAVTRGSKAKGHKKPKALSSSKCEAFQDGSADEGADASTLGELAMLPIASEDAVKAASAGRGKARSVASAKGKGQGNAEIKASSSAKTPAEAEDELPEPEFDDEFTELS